MTKIFGCEISVLSERIEVFGHSHTDALVPHEKILVPVL